MGRDGGVAGDDGHALYRRLSGEQAIEGVAVRLAVQLDVGKAAVGTGVSRRDGQQREALGKQLLGPLLGCLELAEGRLDRDLEQRACAE